MVPNFLKSLEADDIFISYSREDGSAYLTGLDAALSARGFSCFTDKRGTDAGRLPPETLFQKVRLCKTLVLLATPGALKQPENITPELEHFKEANGTSRIICVSFDGGATFAGLPAAWVELVGGKAREREDPRTLTTGKPSDTVVDNIAKASDYMKSKDRLRKYRNQAIGVLALLVALSAGAAGFAWYQLGRAADATAKADAETRRAAQATRDAETALAQAVASQAGALTATTSAEVAKADAVEQKRLAQEASDEAKEQASRAAEAAGKARAAEALAKTQQARAEREQAIGEARSLANRSQTILRQRPEEASQSAAVALSAMEKTSAARFHSVEADTALRESLALFPHLRHTHWIAKGNEANDAVGAVALSPDGRHFALVYGDEKLRVYDSETKAQVQELDCQCTEIALSSGANYAAALTEGGILIFDVPKRQSRLINVPDERLEHVALSPAGRYLAYSAHLGDGDGDHSSVTVLDLKNGAEVIVFDDYDATPGDKEEAAAPDGKDRKARPAAFETLDMLVHDLAFGPTGHLAAGGNYNSVQGKRLAGRVAFWRLQLDPEGFDPQRPERDLTKDDFRDREFIMQKDAVMAVAPGADDSSFVTEAGVWKRLTGQIEFETVARLGYRLKQPYKATIQELAFGPDGRSVRLVKGIEGVQREQENDETVLETWDAAGHWESARAFQAGEVANLVFHPGGEFVAAVGESLTAGEPAVVIRAADGAPADPVTFEAEPEQRKVKAFSQTRDFIIEADDKVAVVWDVWAKKKRTLALDGRLSEVDAAAVSPGGKFFALSGKDGRGKKSVVVYGAQGGAASPRVIPQDKVRELAGDEGKEEDEENSKILAMSLSEDGGRLAVTYYYGETFVRVWDVRGAADVSPLCLKEYAARADKGCLSFLPSEILLSPDGRFLVATDDVVTGLMDLSKRRAAEFKELRDDMVVTALAFSPDSLYLGLGSDEGFLHVYETRRPDDEIARLRHTGKVTAVAFNDAGRYVATASSAQNRYDTDESFPIRVWHLRPKALRDEAEARLGDLRKYGRLPER